MTAITFVFRAALLHFLWQGLLVTLLLWITLFILRKRSANLRYIASAAALAGLFALPIVTTWMLYRNAPANPVSLSAVWIAPLTAVTQSAVSPHEWV